eukprot:Amastigsp_a841750_96.p1 type:complete len:422 gc:universal Amastigsp_a841750_96:1312-47(-)
MGTTLEMLASARVAARVAAVSAVRTKASLAGLTKRDLEGKRVLVRADLNVPQDKKTFKVKDDTRIRESLPTIKFLREAGAKIILCSHMGRPKGVTESLRLNPVAERLNALGVPVTKVDDCIGPDVEAAIAKMKNGEIVLLENLRFHGAEEKNDVEFARKLANGADVYVNDAFGAAHRAHASTSGVAPFVQRRVAGFLMAKEIEFLQGAVENPKRPFVAVIGGAKVSTKIPVLESLLGKCDKLLIGGGMMFTFLAAQGLSVGKSLVERDFVPAAAKILEKAQAKRVPIVLPVDVVSAESIEAPASSAVTSAVSAMQPNLMGLDIGPKSIALFERELASAKTVIWNGPMGVFEVKHLAAGTFAMARAISGLKGAVTIVGGGDSVAAVQETKLQDKFSHVSTGGGASLEMLEGQVLPGVACLDD